ncbi:hypothetical protein BDZ89DRAFT_1059303, partial [Hymenopellis radicata]
MARPAGCHSPRSACWTFRHADCIHTSGYRRAPLSAKRNRRGVLRLSVIRCLRLQCCQL